MPSVVGRGLSRVHLSECAIVRARWNVAACWRVHTSFMRWRRRREDWGHGKGAAVKVITHNTDVAYHEKRPEQCQRVWVANYTFLLNVNHTRYSQTIHPLSIYSDYLCIAIYVGLRMNYTSFSRFILFTYLYTTLPILHNFAAFLPSTAEQYPSMLKSHITIVAF